MVNLKYNQYVLRSTIMEEEAYKLTIVRDKSFADTYHPMYDAIGIYTFQKPYDLKENEYLILTKPNSKLSLWAHIILAGSIGWCISVFVRYVYSFFSQGSDVKIWELLALFFTVVVTLILWGLSAVLPNDKKKLLQRISKHFEENQPLKGIVEKK